MISRDQILNDLIESVSSKKNGVNEVKTSTLVKGAVAAAGLGALIKAFKLPPPSKFSKRESALTYSKALMNAKDNQQSVAAIVGLLNISARILLSVPELRDLGHRVMKVVQSERLEDFMTEE